MRPVAEMMDNGAGSRWGLCLVATALLLLVCPLILGPASALAQADTGAPADSTDTEAPEDSGGPLSEAAKRAQEGGDQEEFEYEALPGPFFVSLTNAPKAGGKADVRLNSYFGEMITTLSMRSRASFTNTLKWGRDEYRKQNKNVERRSEKFDYKLGDSLPFVLSLDGERSWSHDKTVNTAGFVNLYAQDNKTLKLKAGKTKFQLGGLTHSLRFNAMADDKQSETQGTTNNSSQATSDGGLQTGWEIQPGVAVAGRVSGTTSQGNRTLGAQKSPSSAQGDTLGIGLYFNRNFAVGNVSMTRSSFSKKYLDFKKNASGLIDTVGVDEADKVVDELETRDAMSITFDSIFDIAGVYFTTKASRTTDDQDFQINGLGRKERQLDTVSLQSGFQVGVDSLVVTYDYGWKWDDQRLQGATSNRGRQYNKTRDLKFVWQRPLFKATTFKARYHQGLGQDIAQFEHNQNDKDRLQNDYSLQVDRIWPEVFRTTMVYSFRQTQDLSIREARSSNNNINELYEITPSYTWYAADWLTWDQSYRVSIQYTDYVYSDLERVTREDNYNKRGKLTSTVTLQAGERLELIFRHDFNKKFNATKVGVDATGSTFYSRDLNQTISKLDLGLTFLVVKGVTVEAATFRTRDDRESPGRANSETTEFAGEIWVGTKIDKTWRSNITLSAVVKKFNAYGPSVTSTSASYWRADVWLKWSF